MLTDLLNALNKASSDISAATAAATSVQSQSVRPAKSATSGGGSEYRKQAFSEGLRAAKQITSPAGEAFYGQLYEQTGGVGPFYDPSGKPLDLPSLPPEIPVATTASMQPAARRQARRTRRARKSIPIPSFTGPVFAPDTVIAAGPHMEMAEEGGGNARNYTRILAGLGESGAAATEAATKPAPAASSTPSPAPTSPTPASPTPASPTPTSPSPAPTTPSPSPRDDWQWERKRNAEDRGTLGDLRGSRRQSTQRLATILAGEKGGTAGFTKDNATRQAERAAEAEAMKSAGPWGSLTQGLSGAFSGPLGKMPGGIMDAFRNAQKAAETSMGGWNGKGGSGPMDGLKAFLQASGGKWGGGIGRILGFGGGGHGGMGGSGRGGGGGSGGGVGGGGGLAGAAGDAGGAGEFAAGLPKLAMSMLKGPIGRALGAPLQAVMGAADIAGAAGRNLADPHSKPLGAAGDVAEAGIGAAGGVGGALVGTALGGPIGGIIGGVVGKAIVEPIGKVVSGLISAPEKIREFGEALIQNTAHLRRWSVDINNAHAKLQLQDLQLQAHSAQATGGSVRGMGEALGELRKELQPINEGWENLRNNVGTIAMYMGVYALQSVKRLDELLDRGDMIYHIVRTYVGSLIDLNKGGDASVVDLFQRMRDARNWGDKAGRPVNWRVGERTGKRL